jgi:hypothetical protein
MSPRRGRTTAIKRVIRHVVVFALLGMVMTYAVAWGCLIHLADCQWAGDFESEKLSHSSRWDDIDERYGWYPCFEERAIIRGASRSIVYRPIWGSEYDGARPICELDEGGWPSIAVHGRFFVTEEGEDVVEWALPFGRANVGMGFGILPLQPLFPGVLINTAFYGGILWLLWLTISRGAGMLRRGSRRRRGLCARCGYDLRGSAGGGSGAPCPECGGLSAATI